MAQERHVQRVAARLKAVFLLVCVAFLAASCGSESKIPLEELTVALLVVEGGALGMESEYRNAAELVRREAAVAGGIDTPNGRVPLRLETLTHGPGVEDGLRAMRKALASGAACVIGGATSEQALPMAALAEENRVPFISPGATIPQLTTSRNYAFRIPYSDAFQARAVARLCRDGGAQRAAVLFDQGNIYSRTLAAEFKQAFIARGGKQAELAGYQDAKDSAPLLRRLLRSRPEVLFLPVYHVDAPLLVRQARALGFRGDVLGTDGWDLLRNVDMEGMTGARFLVVWHPSGQQTEVARGFLERYTAAFGRQPNSVSAQVYDAFGLLFRAARQARSFDPQVLAAALRDATEFSGVVGYARYSMGTPARDAQILEISSRGLQRAGTVLSAETGEGSGDAEVVQ